MKSFYALTRQIHLFCGLILALAILFYTVSGVTFVYAKWIPREPTRDSTQTTPIPAEFNASVATLREYVASEVSARGRTDGFNALPTGGFRQRWNSPSMRVEAEITDTTACAGKRVKTSERTQRTELAPRDRQQRVIGRDFGFDTH